MEIKYRLHFYSQISCHGYYLLLLAMMTYSIVRLDGKHVVFGKVADEDSMRVVKSIEAVGSQSGK